MPTLHEELAKGSVSSSCTLCAYLASCSPEEAREWQAELALPISVVGNTAVVNALAKRKVDLTEASVRRHRSRHVPR